MLSQSQSYGFYSHNNDDDDDDGGGDDRTPV
jgi:hypothetical protein